MIGPTWIRPWPWRIAYHALEWLVIGQPLGLRVAIWTNRIQQRYIVDRFGPFAPRRGYWYIVYDADGTRHMEHT